MTGTVEAKGHGAEVAGGVSIVVGYGTGYPRHYYDYRRHHHRYSPFYPRSYYYGRHYRRHYYDDRPKKPRAARIIIVDGITYELIDGQYYRRQGEAYRLESPPRAGSYRVLGAREKHQPGYKPGQTLSRLPEPNRQVRVDGHLYWMHQGIWFASLAQGGFVVIQPPK
ncbi:hypothetical protein [Ferrimonas sp. YFM]|uniref:hypothetical protein n=1 Tax=Ferrimonas sp. YFM TaxID=3028878 RepID=UPI002572AD38|nr:hypothetical protein [Ferrimonas sp. YFM]